MAEYYPLLAKAVGSLPNSTLETRRVVYERARKALIGQLRTLHPPVADEDIERESLELDRAVQRLESELAQSELAAGDTAQRQAAATGTTKASAGGSTAEGLREPQPASAPRPAPADQSTPAVSPPPSQPATRLPIRSAQATAASLSSGGATAAKPRPASAPPILKPPIVRAKLPIARPPTKPVAAPPADPAPPARDNIDNPALPVATPREEPPAVASAQSLPAATAAPVFEATPSALPDERPAATPTDASVAIRPRTEHQRPFAPAPPADTGTRRRVWILPVGIGILVAAVATAAYELRDTRQSLTKPKVVEAQPSKDSGKIAERVGDAPSEADHPAADASAPATPDRETKTAAAASAPTPAAPVSPAAAPAPAPAAPVTPAAPANPELPVAQRAALLMEAPNEANKVKTFIGNVVWRLNNVSEGPGAGVGLAVEADIDIPDDKLKAVITFEKNTDNSLPASHTVKVRFTPQPGSASGDVQQISVPQMRQEDNPTGEALTGVTVPVMQNTFLVGLSPGTAEVGNIHALAERQWIDVPILLSSGKVAKLTFEKGQSGTRDINEAIAAWQKS